MQRRRAPWWDNGLPLLIVILGLSLPAPLGHPHFALAGVLLSAVAARIALAIWRLSGLPPFRPHPASAAPSPPSA